MWPWGGRGGGGGGRGYIRVSGTMSFQSKHCAQPVDFYCVAQIKRVLEGLLFCSYQLLGSTSFATLVVH